MSEIKNFFQESAVLRDDNNVRTHLERQCKPLYYVANISVFLPAILIPNPVIIHVSHSQWRFRSKMGRTKHMNFYCPKYRFHAVGFSNARNHYKRIIISTMISGKQNLNWREIKRSVTMLMNCFQLIVVLAINYRAI